MLRFAVRRLAFLPVAVFVILSAAFFLVRTLPGGPFDRERSLPPAVQKRVREAYHLDEPVWRQYVRYLEGVAADLDFGPSTRYANRSVNGLLADSLPTSFALGAAALAFAVLLGAPIGVWSAARPRGALPLLSTTLALVGVALPSFVVASLLLLLFGFVLEWLPVAGWGTPAHVVLPAIALGLPVAAVVARLVRVGMIDALSQDFARTARADGVAPSRILWRHAFRIGCLPAVSYLGPAAASVLTGSFVVEKIFAIPGMGAHFVNSVLNRDAPLLVGCAVTYFVVLYVMNLFSDLVHAGLDPRIRLR
ncbi:MAG: ABC transporter permease [Planctomycetes bacterium]|nr:ABC transporter permease [Planctomycetota bacterium]